MRDLFVAFDPGQGRRAGIEHALRSAIRAGRLSAGATLPSSRALAADLGVSRATVVAAYDQLAAEGYLVARHGAGTAVADVYVPPRHEAEPPAVALSHAADFRPGEGDGSLFPRRQWMRALRHVLAEAPDDTFGYGDPAGHPALRTALAEYLGRTRAVHTSPDDLSVFAGISAALGFIVEAVRRKDHRTAAARPVRVAVEDPCLFFLRGILQLAGAEVLPVGLDTEGIDIEALSATDPDLVMVTPSHQYPMGVTMSPQRRTELITWARDADTWIVEDDYDGEFRYDRQPIGTLQGLAPDRVIYAGTASKSLGAGLRMGWLALPPTLRSRVASVKHLRGSVSVLDQLALAELIRNGALDRHVRAMRHIYHRRQRTLADHLASDIDWLDCDPSPAGLHFTATIRRGGLDDDWLVRDAREHDIGLLGLTPHWATPAPTPGIVVGFGRPAEHQFHWAVEQLMDFLVTI